MNTDRLGRFWAKVDKAGLGECWVWTGVVTNRGYGDFQFEHTHNLAHRYSWELHRGPIPVGMLVLHRCDNPPCVRPAHLFLGTQSDNIKDAYQKGRKVPAKIKLSDAAVDDIRYRVFAGARKSDLAREFGVSRALVRHIAAGTRRFVRSSTPTPGDGETP